MMIVKFTAESDGERILKFSQHWQKYGMKHWQMYGIMGKKTVIFHRLAKTRRF